MPLRCISLIVAVAAWLLSSSAFAGYAMLNPPAPLVLQPGGVTTINYGSIAAANAPRIAGGHVLVNTSLNLGARTVVVPVALRVAANASVFAATKLNPYVAAASLVVSAWQLVDEWFSRDPVAPPMSISPDGHIWIAPVFDQPEWMRQYVIDSITGELVQADFGPRTECNSIPGVFGSPGTAAVVTVVGSSPCGYQVGGWQGPMVYGVNTEYRCNVGWTHPGNNQGSNQKVIGSCITGGPMPAPEPTSPDAGRLTSIGYHPLDPRILPWLWPEVPVDPIPIINPLVEPTGDPLVGPNVNPAPEASPSPMRFPNGEAVPNPGTNPQTYQQPWYYVTPAPTAAEPWRVEVTQVTTTEDAPIPDTDPPPYVQQLTDCDKYPESLSCAEFEEEDDEDIPRENRHIFLVDGASLSGGSCPSNLAITSLGQTFQVFDSSVACGWIAAARPVILFLAALSALTIVRPGGHKVRAISVDD